VIYISPPYLPHGDFKDSVLAEQKSINELKMLKKGPLL